MFLKKVIESFNKKKLDYAIVGGYALALHGAVRGTVDIDIVIAITEKNLQRAQSALESLGLYNKLPVNAKELFNFRKEYIKNKNLIAWNFTNPTDATESVDILITQDLKKLQTVKKHIGSFKVKVVSIKDLIKMKKQSGRPQDIEDIKALEKLQ